MTTIRVHPNPGGPGPAFRAVADGAEGSGAAPGEAIDALFAQTGRPTGAALILLQPFGPDEFFPAARRDRLADLMGRWRVARDAGLTFPADDRAELDVLVDEELQASAARCAALLGAVRP